MRRCALIWLIAILAFAATGPTSGAQSPTTYTVQPDDTLESIAERFEVSLVRVAQANALIPPNRLRTDQMLIIPDPSLPPPRAIAEHEMLKGLYVTFYGIGYPPLREHVQALLVETELNAVVIDVKGDRGWVPYTSTVPLALEVGAQDLIMIQDMQTLMKWFQAHDIYTIARIVVFKDNPLATHHPEWAVHNVDTGGLWIDGEGLAWTDPFGHKAWDYNIALAVEAAEWGFDEVQFDYVRFPTDGPVNKAQYSRESTEANRRGAITGFLARAREALEPYEVELAVDVFGYTCWRIDDMGIGQVLEDLAQFVDVICPMVYPSTYVRGGGMPGYREAVPYPYHIVYYNVRRALERIAGSHATIRPWLQDFPDYAYDGRVYTPSEIRAQIQAARWAGAPGWMLWDPRVRYTLEALRPASEYHSPPLPEKKDSLPMAVLRHLRDRQLRLPLSLLPQLALSLPHYLRVVVANSAPETSHQE